MIVPQISRPLAAMILACGLAVSQDAGAADLCVDGLCVVRAQVDATDRMTRYAVLYFTVENRTGRDVTVDGFSTDAADSVQLLRGDDWGRKPPRTLRVAPNEYRSLDGVSEWRLMLIGLRRQLTRGETVFIELRLKSGRKLTVPFTVL